MLFFAGMIIAIVGLHGYLWKRLGRDTLRPGWPRRTGGVVVVLLATLLLGTLAGTGSGNTAWLAWPGYVWMAVMFYLFVVLLILELPRLAVALVQRSRRRDATGTAASGPVREIAYADESRYPAAAAPSGTPAPPATTATVEDTETAVPGSAPSRDDDDHAGIERRLLLARGAAIVAGLTATGVTAYGIRTAVGPPRLDRVQIPIRKLPRALDGTRLAVVSDIHLGPVSASHHVERIVRLINSVNADIVCVVGDLVDGTVAELGRFAQPLAGIESRRGAYFVTGNHEYYSGFQPWIDEVAKLGVRPLRNERIRLGGLDLAGVNDLGGDRFGDGPDFDKALGDRDTTRPVVLMAHQPVVAHQAARYGVDLQVSGHTHGGQMVPFNLVVRMQQPIVSGFGRVDGVPVYVTNGAGFWGPPVRVGAPPQVSVIDLRTP